MTTPCLHEEDLGKIKEFMKSTKGIRATLFTMSLAIIVQVVTFSFLWGSLTTTVTKNTDQLWNKTIPIVDQNTRDIDKILGKLDFIEVGYAKTK